MKTLRTLFTCGLLMLVCAAGAFAQTIQTDYDRNFNLARLKTFAFYQQDRNRATRWRVARSTIDAFTMPSRRSSLPMA